MEKSKKPVAAHKVFASNLLYLRESKGLLRKQVAYEVDTEISTYRHWEQGVNAPNYDIVIKLARFHNVTIDDLLTKYLISECAALSA